MVDSFFDYDGLRVATHRDVYMPNEDTYLLAEHAAFGPGKTVVEVGCGAGIASMVAARSGARAVAVDVNREAVALTDANARLNGLDVLALVGDLFSAVRPEAIDRLMANPPYLPTSSHEHVTGPLDAAFDGGPDGMRVVARLADDLEAVGDRLPAGFEALLVASSLQDIRWLRRRLEAGGFTVVDVDAARLPFEGLVLLHVARAKRRARTRTGP
jgi:release factor glutamine methyltransferase